MKREDLLKFRIDQLRKDKMIYALESIAFTFISELGYVLITIITGQAFSNALAFLCLLFPLGYFLFMAAGNTRRLLKIRRLEQELYRQ